jgi:hypothetical protein
VRTRAAGFTVPPDTVKETIPGRQASCSNLPAFVGSTNRPTGQLTGGRVVYIENEH